MGKQRNLRYPALDLGSAVEKVELIFQKEGGNGMSRDIAAQHLGYKGLSGASLPAIAAMRKYGLLVGRGDEISVSDRAVTIIADRNADDQRERMKALLTALGNDNLFGSLFDKYGREGSEINITAFLTKSGYKPSVALKAARNYVASIEFVTDQIGDYNLLNEPLDDYNEDRNKDNRKNNEISKINNISKPDISYMQQDTFNLDEGEVILQWPKRLSKDSFQDFEGWFQLILRRAKRSIDKEEIESEDDDER